MMDAEYRILFSHTQGGMRRFFARNAAVLAWLGRDLVRSRGMGVLSSVRFAQYLLLKRFRPTRALSCLMDAHRFQPTRFLTAVFLRERHALAGRIEELVQPAAAEDFTMAARRSLVLKRPAVRGGRIEKGVLLITFTESFPFFSRHMDCEELLKYFWVVLEPSWAGYCNPNILFWTRFADHPIIVEASEQRDQAFLASLRSNLVPVEFGASDWADPRVFRPLPGVQKDYDAIYVCTYKPIKRHHVLFEAVSRIKDPTYRVALLCVSWGGSRAAIEHLMDHYGVRDRIVLFENCPPQKVNELLNRSKVNLLLSVKEGSNRSLFEGMFANVPCILLRNNIGVNKRYINSMTGELVREQELTEALLSFRTTWDRYHPRDWARWNIAPVVTTRKLSARLRALALERNEPWTRDIVAKVNAPEIGYYETADGSQLPSAEAVLSLFRWENTRDPRGKAALPAAVLGAGGVR